ncbi:hypothetical protein ACSBR2_003301 [Camellia fascicularis]
MRKSFKDSLKALEADIQHANTLASDYPQEYDGTCLQMRLSYSPCSRIFLFLVQWTDCHLAGALGLLRILIYKVVYIFSCILCCYANSLLLGDASFFFSHKLGDVSCFTELEGNDVDGHLQAYEDGKTTMCFYERKASIREFYGVIFPSLLQLQRGITDVEDRKQREICATKYKRRDEMNKGKLSEIDIEREEECGICLEVNSKVVLPKCNHSMCMKCYRNWHTRSQSCPFCRDSLKRVNSGDLWIYTSGCDNVDLSSIAKENLKRLIMYIGKLPLIVPDPMLVSYDPHFR